MYDEYEELVRLLKDKAERFDYDGWVDTAVVMEKAADAIEKLIEVIQNHDFIVVDGKVYAAVTKEEA